KRVAYGRSELRIGSVDYLERLNVGHTGCVDNESHPDLSRHAAGQQVGRVLRNRAAVRELHRVVDLEARVDVIAKGGRSVRRKYRRENLALRGSPCCVPIRLLGLAVGTVVGPDSGDVCQRSECSYVLSTA